MNSIGYGGFSDKEVEVGSTPTSPTILTKGESMNRRYFFGLFLVVLPLLIAGKSIIWKADSNQSKPATVTLVPTEDYRNALTGKETLIVIDSVYWIEDKDGMIYIYGDKAEPKVYPKANFVIKEIKVK